MCTTAILTATVIAISASTIITLVYLFIKANQHPWPPPTHLELRHPPRSETRKPR